MPHELPLYLRAGEIADMLGISKRTIWRWIADGTLPSCRLGGARLVARSDLERLLEPADRAPWNDEDDDH